MVGGQKWANHQAQYFTNVVITTADGIVKGKYDANDISKLGSKGEVYRNIKHLYHPVSGYTVKCGTTLANLIAKLGKIREIKPFAFYTLNKSHAELRGNTLKLPDFRKETVRLEKTPQGKFNQVLLFQDDYGWVARLYRYTASPAAPVTQAAPTASRLRWEIPDGSMPEFGRLEQIGQEEGPYACYRIRFDSGLSYIGASGLFHRNKYRAYCGSGQAVKFARRNAGIKPVSREILSFHKTKAEALEEEKTRHVALCYSGKDFSDLNNFNGPIGNINFNGIRSLVDIELNGKVKNYDCFAV